MKRYTDILLYIPNLIGYLRILLLFVGCCMHNEVYFIMLIIISAGLDVADGIAARQLRQESAFGEWFDIVIDLFTRGLLWSWSFPLFGFLVFGFEFLVFVSVHCSGYSWQNKKRKMHWLASLTVSKGFKTPFGVVAMVGLWVLPVYCYVYTHALDERFCSLFDLSFCVHVMPFVLTFLIFCRAHCAFVELCFLKNHVLMLLECSIQREYWMFASTGILNVRFNRNTDWVELAVAIYKKPKF